MTDGLRSLRDLVEEGAASRGIVLRTVWGWALDAVVANSLIPALPAGVSLDTPFDSSGMPLTWRKVASIASRSIKKYIPENDQWANTLMFDSDAFNKWFADESATRDHRTRSPPPPPQSAGQNRPRQRPVEARAVAVLKLLYPQGVPDQVALPNKRLCAEVHKHLSVSKEPAVSDETIKRAAGRRPR